MSDNQGFPRMFGGYAQPQQQQQQQSQQEEKPPPKRRGKKRDATSLSSAAGTNADDGEEESASSMVFPVRLHRMLTLIDEKGTTSTTSPAPEASASTDPNAPPHETEENPAGIVSWQPHGRCFLVHDKDAFTQSFLPR
jgi:cytoskeletal protein RodZ